MLLCPRCTTEIAPERGPHGTVFPCGACKGVAATMPVLRRRLEANTINDLWQRARRAKRHAGRPCPQCHDAMAEVPVHRGDREFTVEACDRCLCLWFDFDELEVLPSRPTPPPVDPLSPEEARERAARNAQREHDTFETVDDRDAELTDWAGVETIAGVEPGEGRPWATWGVTVALFATAAVVMSDAVKLAGWIALVGGGFQRACHDWGFVPADPWRHGGATWLTAFLLHADWGHLIGNSLVLVILGETLEPNVGWRRILATLALGAIAALLAHLATHVGDTTPVVGASGGIAGLFAWLALRFPRAIVRIPLIHDFRRYGAGSMLRLNLRMRTAFLIWFAIELLASATSSGHVAHEAHVGGALAGVGLWWFERRRANRSVAA